MNLLTTKQAAAIIGIGRHGVLKAIERGQIEAVKHGRDWIITAEEARRYKAERNRPGRPRGNKSA